MQIGIELFLHVYNLEMDNVICACSSYHVGLWPGRRSACKKRTIEEEQIKVEAGKVNSSMKNTFWGSHTSTITRIQRIVATHQIVRHK